MPKCSEGYISRKIRNLMYSWGPGTTVVAVAQELQSNITGASDALGFKAMEEAAEIVEFYIDNWLPNPNKTNKAAYDAAVLELLKAVNRMYKERMVRLAKMAGIAQN